MIEPMKKTTIVCLAQDQEQSLRVLQRLASVHLCETAPPSSQRLEEARRDYAALENALNRLAAFPAQAAQTAADQAAAGTRAALSPQECADEVLAALDSLRAAMEQETQLLAAIRQLEPWGHFDEARLKRLEAAGWHTALCAARPGAPLPENLPEGTVFLDVHATRDLHCFLVLLIFRQSSCSPPFL